MALDFNNNNKKHEVDAFVRTPTLKIYIFTSVTNRIACTNVWIVYIHILISVGAMSSFSDSGALIADFNT